MTLNKLFVIVVIIIFPIGVFKNYIYDMTRNNAQINPCRIIRNNKV